MQSILMICCEEKKVVFGFFKDENGLAGKGKAPKGGIFDLSCVL